MRCSAHTRATYPRTATSPSHRRQPCSTRFSGHRPSRRQPSHRDGAAQAPCPAPRPKREANLPKAAPVGPPSCVDLTVASSAVQVLSRRSSLKHMRAELFRLYAALWYHITRHNATNFRKSDRTTHSHTHNYAHTASDRESDGPSSERARSTRGSQSLCPRRRSCACELPASWRCSDSAPAGGAPGTRTTV